MRLAPGTTDRCAVALVILFSCFVTLMWAESESTCRSSNVVSVPSRPTVTNATDTTQCGVVEFEYGLERQWPGGGANRDDLSGGLRLGLTHSLDFHWSSGTPKPVRFPSPSMTWRKAFRWV